MTPNSGTIGREDIVSIFFLYPRHNFINFSQSHTESPYSEPKFGQELLSKREGPPKVILEKKDG